MKPKSRKRSAGEIGNKQAVSASPDAAIGSPSAALPHDQPSAETGDVREPSAPEAVATQAHADHRKADGRAPSSSLVGRILQHSSARTETDAVPTTTVCFTAGALVSLWQQLKRLDNARRGQRADSDTAGIPDRQRHGRAADYPGNDEGCSPDPGTPSPTGGASSSRRAESADKERPIDE